MSESNSRNCKAQAVWTHIREAQKIMLSKGVKISNSMINNFNGAIEKTFELMNHTPNIKENNNDISS